LNKEKRADECVDPFRSDQVKGAALGAAPVADAAAPKCSKCHYDFLAFFLDFFAMVLSSVPVIGRPDCLIEPMNGVYLTGRVFATDIWKKPLYFRYLTAVQLFINSSSCR
jgi:hypothetical protein